MSPAPGTSTLITWAPKSPSMVEQKGPARAWDKSRILTSSSGSCIGGVSPSVERLERVSWSYRTLTPALSRRERAMGVCVLLEHSTHGATASSDDFAGDRGRLG